MTKEEQELLYKELSARQFYGVRLEGNPEDPELLTGIEGLPTDNWVTFYTDMNVINVNFALGTRQQVPRPYLRSLSTMTEEEYEELFKNLRDFTLPPQCYQTFERTRWLKKYCYETTDFFLKHHFNFRLPKHLYIEMPKEMYNQKPERK